MNFVELVEKFMSTASQAQITKPSHILLERFLKLSFLYKN